MALIFYTSLNTFQKRRIIKDALETYSKIHKDYMIKIICKDFINELEMQIKDNDLEKINKDNEG